MQDCTIKNVNIIKWKLEIIMIQKESRYKCIWTRIFQNCKTKKEFSIFRKNVPIRFRFEKLRARVIVR